MPNYNHGRYLRQALRAVLDQSYPPNEVIVVDDASTDDSLRILERMAAEDARIRVVRNGANQGPVHSLNLALSLASGDYVMGAAADDLALPGFYERSMSLLARYPQAALCTARSCLIDEAGRHAGWQVVPRIVDRPSYLTPERVRHLLRSTPPWFVGNTAIYKRQFLNAVGGFDPRLLSYSDSFTCLVLALKHGACFLPESVSAWRTSPLSYSSRTTGDLKLSLQAIDYAVQLMRGSYRDVVPAEYVPTWVNLQVHALRQRAYRELRTAERAFLENLAPTWQSPHLGDRAALRLLRFSMGLQYLAFGGYLFARSPRLWRPLLRVYLEKLRAGAR